MTNPTSRPTGPVTSQALKGARFICLFTGKSDERKVNQPFNRRPVIRPDRAVSFGGCQTGMGFPGNATQ